MDEEHHGRRLCLALIGSQNEETVPVLFGVGKGRDQRCRRRLIAPRLTLALFRFKKPAVLGQFGRVLANLESRFLGRIEAVPPLAIQLGSKRVIGLVQVQEHCRIARHHALHPARSDRVCLVGRHQGNPRPSGEETGFERLVGPTGLLIGNRLQPNGPPRANCQRNHTANPARGELYQPDQHPAINQTDPADIRPQRLQGLAIASVLLQGGGRLGQRRIPDRTGNFRVEFHPAKG